MTYQARRRYGRDQRATAIGAPATVLATVVPGTAPAPATTPRMVENLRLDLFALKNANVRAAPSISAARIAHVGRGRRVTVTGRSGEWYRVGLARGRTGWVWGELLGARPALPPPIASAPARKYRPGESFKDCDGCPTVVAVPPGTFVMGSTTGGEGPRHHVIVPGALAVGKYEVTFAQWDACRADGGCAGHQPDDRGWGRDRRPVIGVSWRDATAYVAWLAAKTGKPYRLLSEAEWEYAARAGIAAPSAWGRHLDGACVFANVHDLAGERSAKSPGRPYPCDDGYAGTAPIGSYHVNRFGLHDMLGNVAEWVSDCWWPDHQGAPPNGAARDGDRCRRRVVRGGSWRGQMGAVRVSARRAGAIDRRDAAVGFRVVRGLENEFGGVRRVDTRRDAAVGIRVVRGLENGFGVVRRVGTRRADMVIVRSTRPRLRVGSPPPRRNVFARHPRRARAPGWRRHRPARRPSRRRRH
jgi:formylglycine-generating enzyme required for sulfatase activity